MIQKLKLPARLDGRVWRYANLASANRLHRHAELEINLVTRGRGVYLLGGRRYEIRRGDLLWLFPSQEHVLAEQTPEFEMWIAVFRRRAVTRATAGPETRALVQRNFEGEAGRRLQQQDLVRLERLFEELSTSVETSLINAGLRYALLRAWKSFERAGEVPARELHPAVERAARLVREEPAEAATSLAEIALRAGLSASRLSRLFKEQTGTALVDFRNQQRIERFRSVYDSGQRLTLLDSALEAGFGSYPQFHRVFRQRMGCSPREYASREK